jgi:hypothetical protein
MKINPVAFSNQDSSTNYMNYTNLLLLPLQYQRKIAARAVP